MNGRTCLLGAFLVLIGCSAPPEQVIVNDAAGALGELRKSSCEHADDRRWGENTNLGQSLTPDAECL